MTIDGKGELCLGTTLPLYSPLKEIIFNVKKTQGAPLLIIYPSHICTEFCYLHISIFSREKLKDVNV